MKFLQKATLAAAVAAAPFAAQALQPIADAELGGVTGQAGVTIELDMGAEGITVGEIQYTDTAGSGDTDGGSVLIQDLNISQTEITQTIDVDADGSLKIGMTTNGDINLRLGSHAGNVGAAAVAISDTSGNVSEVVNNVNMGVTLARNNTTVVNMANSGNAAKYGINQAFDFGTGSNKVTSNAADAATAIVVDMGVKINDLDVGLFGYTASQAVAKVSGLALTGGNTLQQEIVARNNTATSAKGDLDSAVAANTGHVVTYGADGKVATIVDSANGNADVSATYTTETNAHNNAVDAKAQTDAAGALAGGSAIQLNNIKFDDGAGNAVTVKQTIWAQGGNAASGGGVYIAMGDINGTLTVGETVLGGASIGTLAVKNIQLNGLTQRIYGH